MSFDPVIILRSQGHCDQRLRYGIKNNGPDFQCGEMFRNTIL